MGNAVGQMLASAVGIAISPLPLIAVILMLSTPRGRGNGIAFAAGWVGALAVACTVVVLLGAGISGGDHSQTGTRWLKLGLGLVFLLLAAKQWRGRPADGETAEPPGWMQAIDGFTPLKSGGLAAALAVANPKNLVLVVGGAVSIATSSATGGGKAVATVLMVLVASLCTTLPLGVYLFGGERAATVLGGWKAWMSRHNAAIMIVVLTVLGVKYLGDALTG